MQREGLGTHKTGLTQPYSCDCTMVGYSVFLLLSMFVVVHIYGGLDRWLSWLLLEVLCVGMFCHVSSNPLFMYFEVFH